MAAIGVGTKYHLAINGQGFLLAPSGYSKQDANVFIPRFGTGSSDLGDLDLFKTLAQTDLSGGSFQDVYDDPTKFSLIKNMVYNSYDKALYTTPTATNITMSSYTAWRTSILPRNAVYNGDLYFAANGLGSVASGYGAIYKYNGAGGITSVKTNFSLAVTDVIVFNGLLFVFTGGSGGSVWAYNGTTWTEDNRYGFRQAAVLRDNMVTNGTTGSNAGTISLRDGTAGTSATVTSIGAVGDANIAISSMVSFNSRVYIGKPDGLFVYDGVLVSNIMDTSKDLSSSNFKFMTSYNGTLYFVLNNSIYSFNGSFIEKIREFNKYESIVYLGVANGRLYITTKVLTTSSDKWSNQNDSAFYYYDGVGWFCYHTVTSSSTFSTPLGFMYSSNTSGDKTFIEVFANSSFSEVQLKYIDMNQEYTAVSNNTGIIITSEFAADFPDINKYLDAFTVKTKDMAASDSILVEFRIHNGTSWSSFSTLGTIISTLSKLQIHKTSLSSTFRKIQFRLTVTRDAASTMAIKEYSMDYYLTPQQRWQWRVRLQTTGSDSAPLPLLDNSTESANPPELRESIYAARSSSTPISFEDIDYTKLNGSLTDSATTLTVDTTDTMRTAGFVKIDDEIIEYTGKTSTTLTGCTRGALQTAAATHTDNTIVNSYYRAVLTSIDSEIVALPNQLETGQESQIQITLEEARNG